MRRALFYTVGILGALAAWSSIGAAQQRDDHYNPYLRAQHFPPNYYLPRPSYAPPPSYIPAPNYDVPPGYHAQRLIGGMPYVEYHGAPAYRYAPPPAAEYVPPVPVLIPLRPRSCGEYRYWNGAYCADARYVRPYLGPQ